MSTVDENDEPELPGIPAKPRSRVADTVVRIFDYWKLVTNHPRAQLDIKRTITIRRILKDGYTEDDCRLAIEGCANSSFHQGDNQDGKIYDSIGLIFRDADHLDQFIEDGQKLRQQIERQTEAALKKAAPPTDEQERKGMPENIRQRVREILKREIMKRPKEDT